MEAARPPTIIAETLQAKELASGGLDLTLNRSCSILQQGKDKPRSDRRPGVQSKGRWLAISKTQLHANVIVVKYGRAHQYQVTAIFIG